jgi:hypothetical protein
MSRRPVVSVLHPVCCLLFPSFKFSLPKRSSVLEDSRGPGQGNKPAYQTLYLPKLFRYQVDRFFSSPGLGKIYRPRLAAVVRL